jgi:MFS family permease
MARQRSAGLRAALAHRDFRLLMVALAVSGAGSWAYNVALIVYVAERTHSAGWVGAVTIGRFVPALVLGSYSGVVAERFERVRLMVVLDLACAGLMAGLATVSALRGPALLAIAFGAATSVVTTPYLPAVSAITPRLVPESELAAANTIRNTVDNLAIIAGPAVGAVMLLAGSPTVAFVANGVSFLASAALVSRVGARSTPVDVTEGGSVGPLRQMAVGVRALAGSSSALLLVLFCLVTSFIYGTDTVLLIVVSEQRLGTGSSGYGWLLAGIGIGGVAVAALVARMSAWPRLAPAIIAGLACYCVPTLALLVVRQPVVAVIIEVVRGGGTIVVDVLAVTALQRAVPEDQLGRVFGAFWTFVLLAISLGALVAPLLLRAGGLRSALWVVGGAVPVLCLAGWPALRAMDERNVVRLAHISSRVTLLEGAAVLAGAPHAALERLAAASTEVEMPAGRDVVVEGDEADTLYVVERGQLRVHARRRGAVEQELAILRAGDVFGEIGVLEKIPRTATVSTVEDCALLRIEGRVFSDVLVENTAHPSLLGLAEARLGRSLSAPSPAAAAGAGAGAPAG